MTMNAVTKNGERSQLSQFYLATYPNVSRSHSESTLGNISSIINKGCNEQHIERSEMSSRSHAGHVRGHLQLAVCQCWQWALLLKNCENLKYSNWNLFEFRLRIHIFIWWRYHNCKREKQRCSYLFKFTNFLTSCTTHIRIGITAAHVLKLASQHLQKQYWRISSGIGIF